MQRLTRDNLSKRGYYARLRLSRCPMNCTTRFQLAPVRSTILRSRALTPTRELRPRTPCEGGLLGLLRSHALTPKRELRLGKPCEESVLSNQHRLLREDTRHRAVR